MAASVILWTGGPYHPYRDQAEWFHRLAARSKLELRWSRDVSALKPSNLRRTQLLILAGLHWSGVTSLEADSWEAGEPPPERYETLSEDEWVAIHSMVTSGRLPLLAFHTGLGSFDDQPVLLDMFDGRWIHGQSSHLPVHDFEVVPREPRHPAVSGVSTFTICDELYDHIVFPQASSVVLDAAGANAPIPVAWLSRDDERARRATITLGHDMRACSNASFSTLVANVIEWLVSS